MKKFTILILLLIGLASTPPPTTPAATPELRIGLRRDFGFSSGSGKIQGVFTIKAQGPDDLQRVIFLLDSQPMGESVQPPFSMRFSTDSFHLGKHTLSAQGFTNDGKMLDSNQITAQFVTAKEGWEVGLKILIPILGLAAVVILASTLAALYSSSLANKRKPDIPFGAMRSYGIAGGAICPRCKRPFSRHFLSPNLVFGKLERCPYCGKVSIVSSKSIAELRAAEAAELTATEIESVKPADPEEILRKELDESRYQDL